MTATNASAVFFLGTRAHYQVLSAPEQSYDQDNGNSSTDNIYESNGNEAVIEIEDTREFDFGSGVKRRLRKNRKQDGSSELILNGNEEFTDYESADLNGMEDGGTPKLKSKSRARITVSHLLALLAPRKRGPAWRGELACSYRDSCRCLECQSRYFECDESDEGDDYSHSEDEDSWSQYEEQPTYEEQHMETDEQPDGDDDDDEVFLAPPQPAPAPAPHCPAPSPPPPPPRRPRALGLAAGAPALCDHLLSHPIACVIQ